MIFKPNDILLERIQVQNFKSFDKVDLTLGKFNVFIGSNASGKSNFIQIFNFLHDITEHGLDNAISLQGGVEFLRNFKIGSQSNLIFELDFNFPGEGYGLIPLRKNTSKLKIIRANYKFEIKLGKKSGFKVISDTVMYDCEVVSRTDSNGESHKGKLIIYHEKGQIKLKTDFPKKIFSKEKDFEFYQIYQKQGEQIRKTSLMLGDFRFSHFLTSTLFFFLKRLTVYDFDPKLAKRAVPLSGKIELESDGSNLAIVLKNIIKNSESKRKFENLITELLPFVNGVEVEKFADKSILFKLKETYFKNQKLPSSLISDGTVSITALILALYFQHNPVILIEEPERNIHPSLMTKVIELMKDASQTSQVIVTTHNPEFVRYAGIENIYLVSRSEKGFSNIRQPRESEEVRSFLENDMDIEELYVQNLLGD